MLNTVSELPDVFLDLLHAGSVWLCLTLLAGSCMQRLNEMHCSVFSLTEIGTGLVLHGEVQKCINYQSFTLLLF